MYNIPKEIATDKQLLLTIEDMRKKRQSDEAKALQEKQMEERRLKKIKELEEAAKKSRKPVEQPLYTYDLQGQYVDVVTLNSLPVIAPKCSKQPETMPAEEAALDTSIKADKMRRLSTKVSFMNEVLTDLREKVPRSSGVVSPYAGCYRSFIPALGVTFSEEGREPKKVDGSISQRTGRITKTQFQSMLADPLFGTAEEDVFKKGRLQSTSTFAGRLALGAGSPEELSRTQRVWNRTAQGGVEVSENVGVVLVEDFSRARVLNPNQLSVLPLDNPLQWKKKTEAPKSMGLTAYGLAELEKMEATRYKPIEVPSKPSAMLGKSLPKLKTARTKPNQLRLAPPPIGKSFGHGIMKSARTVQKFPLNLQVK